MQVKFERVGETMNLRLRRAMRSVLAVVMLTVLLCGEALAGIPCYINANTKIYNRPSTSAVSLSVPKNLGCHIEAMNGDWALVRNGNAYAFIPLRYLTLKDRLKGYITKSTPLYRNASSSSSKLGTLPVGMEVYVSGRAGSYFQVQNANGSVTGYVKGSYVSPTKPKTESKPVQPGNSSNSLISTTNRYYEGMSDSQKIEYVIYVAQTLYGKPYSSDADVPNSFDCSRFVKYCYDQIGISLSATAHGQGYDTVHKKISNTGSLKRGDVVCFNTNSSDGDASDHTGIYIGDGYFVHASSSAGKVIVSTLTSGYYKNTFSWGFRIAN